MTSKRGWCFTIYYKKFDDWKERFENWELDKAKYLIVGKEKCPSTGNKHLQGYIYFKSARTRESVQKYLNFGTPHVEIANGSPEQNKKYCEKEKVLLEYGTKPRQGARNDLNYIKKELLGKHRSITELINENNDEIQWNFQSLRFAECLNKYKKPYMRDKLKVYWFWGATGCGKTHTAELIANMKAEKNNEMPYWLEPECKWWDGYDGQKVVIIDEFRQQIMLATLLRLTQAKPMQLPIKGSMTWAKFEYLFITSSKHPKDCYKNVGEDIQQLIRRMYKIKEFNVRYVPESEKEHQKSGTEFT